jgi:hypothetical protein
MQDKYGRYMLINKRSKKKIDIEDDSYQVDGYRKCRPQQIGL